MREALARSDNDFVMVEQPRASRRKSPSSRKPGGGFFRGLVKKPMRVLALVVVAGALVGIGLNATLFQTARHPAPLFGAAPEKPKQAAAPVTPIPAPRPVDLASAPPSRPATAQQAARTPTPPARVEADTKKDPIAALLKGDEPAPVQSGNQKVSAAQRALQKVGFVVKPDGVFGSTTRQALERFERDRGLPVTGELAGRTLKELASQSGVAIP